MLRQKSVTQELVSTSSSSAAPAPVRCGLWAAGFSFSRSDVMLACPYDPRLSHLFFGEESSMAARLFTHG